MMYMTRRSSAAALGLLLALAAVVAACSKTTTQNTVASTQAPGTTAARSDTTQEKRSETTRKTEPKNDDTDDTGGTSTTSRRSTSSTSGGGGGGGGGGMSFTTVTVKPTSGNEEFCNTMADSYNEMIGKLKDVPQSDLKALEEAMIAAFKPMLQAMTDVAPDEIKADLEQMNQVVQNATSAKDMQNAPNQAELTAAGDRVEKFMEKSCGIAPKLGT